MIQPLFTEGEETRVHEDCVRFCCVQNQYMCSAWLPQCMNGDKIREKSMLLFTQKSVPGGFKGADHESDVVLAPRIFVSEITPPPK
jgi:hypothetical protein